MGLDLGPNCSQKYKSGTHYFDFNSKINNRFRLFHAFPILCDKAKLLSRKATMGNRAAFMSFLKFFFPKGVKAIGFR